MEDTIFLKTGQFSSSSFNKTKSDLKRAGNALDSLDNYGALWNATYTCNGVSQRIFSAASIEEANALAALVEKLRNKLNDYSKLLQSGPEELQDTDESFKGTYSSGWDRFWHSVGSGISSACSSTIGFYGSLFKKGGQKTGDKTIITDTDADKVSEEEDSPPDNQTSVIVNPNSDYTNCRRSQKIIPPKENREGKRSKNAYREVMDSFEVETNPRYDNTKGPTYCNIYVWDVTSAMGCEIPHWVDGYELNANGANAWLATKGKENGWEEIDEATAISMANEGYPTVACSDGHIAMVAPSEPGDQGIYLSQAGGIYEKYNGNNRHIPGSYVNYGLQVKYYYHK